MPIRGLLLLWTDRLFWVCLSVWFVLFLEIQGKTRQDSQTQGNNAILRRLLNIETTFLEERLKTNSIQNSILRRLSDIEAKFIEERLKTISIHNQLDAIKSRLDGLSLGMTVQRQPDDEEFIKSYVAEIMTNTLDSIQDGLSSEKQQRFRLENLALEMKGIVVNNFEKLEQKTEALVNKINAMQKTVCRRCIPCISQRESVEPTTKTAQPGQTRTTRCRAWSAVRLTLKPRKTTKKTAKPKKPSKKPIKKKTKPSKKSIKKKPKPIRKPVRK